MNSATAKPVLALVLPIYNEEEQLEDSINSLRAYAEKELSAYDWKIIVGDNASTDSSPAIYRRLQMADSRVGFVRLEKKGRGRMLKKIWLDEPFDVSLYMDVDLSTDLRHIRPCVEAILESGYDLTLGSRLKRGAKVIGRSLLRETTSRGYIAIIKAVTFSRLSDYQCGFKGISKEAALRFMPIVEDTAWFFDSELLLIAEKSGARIYEEPVLWRDDPGSTVNVVKTATEDMRGLARIMRTKPWRQLVVQS